MSRTRIKKDKRLFIDTLTECDLDESEDSEYLDGISDMHELVHGSDVLIYSTFSPGLDTHFGVQKEDSKVNLHRRMINHDVDKINWGKISKNFRTKNK